MSELSAEAQQKVSELKKIYIDSFPDKLEQLNRYWENLQTGKFEESGLVELRIVCHKIAGSSGSHKMLEISQAAQALEQICSSDNWSLADPLSREVELKACYETLIGLMQNCT